ncbi:MAG: hypothetical protein BA862_14635 [Desulfobulbaceae bacterium S3730MH12]|nr:MAG: hypothetical protein BA866_02270 [Desulfobulbaceae bacterium S5133MH15]OEU54145.1 MAG: hypothetical protein BA862_14635 [Desulfobulbaceae bacterium S3730MH12]OEU81350.1 MAG: hypothetical protein BA873_13400 [Desulfobulbaceae bacterium C00003063]
MEATNGVLPAKRQQLILDIIKENYTARCSELSDLLEVSEMTIRRDLGALERQGMVKRTHGGAVFRHERVRDKFKYINSVEGNFEEKKRITQRAAKLIEPNDVVFIGEGTTASLLLNHVEPDMPFTVFTNNHGISAEIDSMTTSIELILLGGVFNSATLSTAGNFTIELIERINANKVFLGADGFSLRAGLTTANQDIAAIDRAMIRHTTGQVIIMSDHTKFGLVAAMEIAKSKEIDILITNLKMSQDFYNDLEALDIKVLVA